MDGLVRACNAAFEGGKFLLTMLKEYDSHHAREPELGMMFGVRRAVEC